MAQEKKSGKQTVKIIKTAVSGVLCVVLAGGIVAANVLIPPNASSVQSILGLKDAGIDNSNANTDGVDMEYSKPKFDTLDALMEDEIALNKQIAAEGIVLLKNDANKMPYSTDTTFSFVSHSSVAYIGGAKGDLKTAFEASGFGVNETLWNFYSEGNGKDYVRGVGSVDYGDAEDFSINECPLSVMQSEEGLLDSMQGTVPVFVFSRIVGEGRDMPRSMYNHTDVPEDQSKTYLEPNSDELAILQYLNDNFDDVVLLLNSGAAVDLSWVSQFPNIHTVISAPAMGDYGLYSLAEIFAGNINPSGRTVDTYEADPLSSPAAQNFGDFSYYTEDGEQTKYNYVSYKEGIYVGYRYYETRYEDAVLGQGNAGDYSYADSVIYPFGYGLSYTTFEWSNYKTSWDGTTCTVTVDVKNTGSRAGKDVVEVFAQSPYTDYDKANNIEKASVELVGYAKTSELAPGASETVTVTFDQEQLKSYDYTTAKTYILDAGDYAPAVNTHRTPFSGRNAEYYSEDPFLAGAMASQEIRGVASRGMYVFVKHFAINDQENHRGDRDGQYSLATFLNEQAAREIYLEPFEMAVKSGTVDMNYAQDNGDGTYSNATTQIPACTGVMTSFNRIGYTWAGGNYNLITGLLRNEWGFHGFVITDNANTGVFMDAGQMIQAGADGKLTNLPTGARYTFDENDVSDYHYGCEAAHNILYTIANSKVMNGGMPGSDYVAAMEPYQKVIYAVDIVCGALIVVLVVLTILRFRKKKQA